MLLSEILAGLDVSGNFDGSVELEDIIYDSRKARAGTLFVCLSGVRFDGHTFARSAYDAGCRAFLCERELSLPGDAAVVRCENSRAALAVCSANLFRHPSRELAVIGITGTKGKTTVAHIVKAVLEAGAMKCGIIGTIGAKCGDTVLPTVNTTPESYELQRLLRFMADNGCKAAAIEVSSLGLKHHRVDSVEFAAAVFTNLSPDHIGTNEHDSFEEYAEWKKELFRRTKRAFLNFDDAFSREIMRDCQCEAVTFGFDEGADLRLLSAENVKSGSRLGVEFALERGGREKSFFVSLPGEVNAYNAACAVAVGEAFGVGEGAIADALGHVFVKGRGEVIETGRDFSVIIDYAHNGVSLKSIVETVRAYNPKRVIALFGSVGGRSEIRRKELGLVSGAMCDLTVITEDDPDFEPVEAICNEIAQYVKESGGDCVTVFDRREAILYALSLARAGDIIILAGKGHEEFMKRRGEKLPFSERAIVEEALNIK